MQVPLAWQTQVDVGGVKIRSKPLRDADNLTHHCCRCGAAVPLVNSHGDACPSCGAEILRSFATFEALPLVEFELAPDVTEADAQALLTSHPLRVNERCVPLAL